MNVHDMNPHIKPTPVYRIEVHARLLILKRNFHLHGQKYSRLRCLLLVKDLVICFFVWAGLAVFFISDKI